MTGTENIVENILGETYDDSTLKKMKKTMKSDKIRTVKERVEDMVSE
jgi:hypothetical protein